MIIQSNTFVQTKISCLLISWAKTIPVKNYLETTRDIYRKAAMVPDQGLCCTTTPMWKLPGLKIPLEMQQMNYGCGSTVHPRDLDNSPSVLYVGVGGGMELLQFAYFSRQPGAVLGIDAVSEMLAACDKNLTLAEQQNEWFRKDFIELREGDALHLPVADNSIQVAAQNCLFNIFTGHDLRRALSEMYRVLRPHGRLILSDPICDHNIPEHLRHDERLRALCLTGAMPLSEYLQIITDTGFGTVEIRAKRPYRLLTPRHYHTTKNIFIESVEICAIKDPMPAGGPCIFTGKTAIYTGAEEYFDDGKGHILRNNFPLNVCDKTAAALAQTNEEIYITPSTFFYDGGGCC